MTPVILGTRGSKLARVQSELVGRLLAQAQVASREHIIVSEGDVRQSESLRDIGGRGVFTRALEEALLQGSVDCAVHSYKDLPTILPEGLCIGAVLSRAPAQDVLVSRAQCPQSLDLFAAGARIGTGSIRRGAILKRFHPHLCPCDIRGNVDTRLRKLDQGDFDALILARAALERMQLDNRISCILGEPHWYHAVAQGAIALQIRTDDSRTRDAIATLNDPLTRACTDAERSLLRSLGGGCQVPLGVRSTYTNATLTLEAFVSSLDATRWLTASASGTLQQAEAIGLQLARILSEQGAQELLNTIGKGD
jgi:hydroxymethylbilane synthase